MSTSKSTSTSLSVVTIWLSFNLATMAKASQLADGERSNIGNGGMVSSVCFASSLLSL